MKTECQGLFGRLFGHKFVGHYNRTPPNTAGIEGSRGAVMEFIDRMTEKTYVCSVCLRCGEKKP
jgi:hypothetical protein